MKKTNRDKQQEDMVIKFNATMPKIRRFRYFSIKTKDGVLIDPDTEIRENSSSASMMCGTAVVWLKGKSGCVALEHLKEVGK